MGELLYYKKGRKYIPLTDEAASWHYKHSQPIDGVWIVRDGGTSKSWVGGIDISPIRIRFENLRDIATEVVGKLIEKRSVSSYDIVTEILNAIAQKVGGK